MLSCLVLSLAAFIYVLSVGMFCQEGGGGGLTMY